MEELNAPVPVGRNAAPAHDVEAKKENPIIPIIIFAALVIGGISFVISIVNEPEMIWTHPTFTNVEQEQVRAECRMRAYDAIGGAPIHDSARNDFQEACWREKGFVEIEERDEESDE